MATVPLFFLLLKPYGATLIISYFQKWLLGWAVRSCLPDASGKQMKEEGFLPSSFIPETGEKEEMKASLLQLWELTSKGDSYFFYILQTN